MGGTRPICSSRPLNRVVSRSGRSSDAASASRIRGRFWSSTEAMGRSLAVGMQRIRAVVAVALLFLLTGAYAPTQSQSVSAITPPSAEFGANIGDDYFLATYSQLEAYWKKLAQESDRLRLVDIGRTEEGRPQWMAIVSSPENLQKLDEYKDISRRLALAEGLNDAQARALAARGKAVVWIDGGLHANETLGAQQLIETVYQLVSRSDEETRSLPERRDRPRGGRESRRARARGQLVHARTGSAAPVAFRNSARVPEVHRARQQSRLLHVNAGRDDQHEPHPLPGVVPADRLRPPPDRAGRNGDVCAAISRSVQLLSRSADSGVASTSSAPPCTRASPPKARRA